MICKLALQAVDCGFKTGFKLYHQVLFALGSLVIITTRYNDSGNLNMLIKISFKDKYINPNGTWSGW